MAIRITGLIQFTQQLQLRMAGITNNYPGGDELSIQIPAVNEVYKDIQEITHRVEALCARRKATPADLPNPSFHAYQWLHFLSQEKWLIRHLASQREFAEILNQGSGRLFTKINPANIDLQIKNFNYLYRSKQTGKTAHLEINEGFICAPTAIKELLLNAAFAGKRKHGNQEIKDYTGSAEFRNISRALQAHEFVNQVSFQGHHFDLEIIYEALNLKYFGGKLIRPRLSWSPRHSRRRLGYFHPESNAITISRSLDSQKVNPLLVDYILYHEMLHKALGIRETNGRRYAHTSAFKKAERRFEKYDQAQTLMQQFSSRP